MKIKKAQQKLILLVFVFLGMNVTVSAEDSSTKEELAWEIMQVAGGGDMAKQISAVMLGSMRQNYKAMVNQLLEAQPSLSIEEKMQVQAHLSDYDSFSRKLSSRLTAAIDFDDLLRNTYVPLYTEKFTKDELQEILKFQSSPVGRKAATLMPSLMQEGMAEITPKIQPIVINVIQQVFIEEQTMALEAEK